MNTKERLKNYLSKISKKVENYEFLKDYHESNLIFIQEFLQDSKVLSNHPIVQAIKDELDRRKKISEEFVNGLKKKFLGKYIRYNLNDGLGSYTIFKVSDVKRVHKDYCEVCYSVSVSNVDGDYSINNYRSGSIKLYSNFEENNLQVITKEDYKKEFDKAIEYYKSLGEDDYSS